MAKMLINKKKKIYIDHRKILSFSNDGEVRLINGKTILSDLTWIDLIKKYNKAREEKKNG